MSTGKQVIEVGNDEWHLVKPIDHIESNGRSRDREFTYRRTFVSDIPETSFEVPSGARYEMVGNGNMLYQYRNRAKILVTPNGPYARPDNSKQSAEKQAYFVLSIMDEHGLVAGWRKA